MRDAAHGSARERRTRADGQRTTRCGSASAGVRIAALLALGPRLDANYAAIKAATLPLDLARLGKPSLVAESAM